MYNLVHRAILRQSHMQKLLKEQNLHESDVLPELETEPSTKPGSENLGEWVPLYRIQEFKSNPFYLLNNTFILERKGHMLDGHKYRITDVELEGDHGTAPNSAERVQWVLYLQAADCWDAEAVDLWTVLDLLRYSRYYKD